MFLVVRLTVHTSRKYPDPRHPTVFETTPVLSSLVASVNNATSPDKGPCYNDLEPL